MNQTFKCNFKNHLLGIDIRGQAQEWIELETGVVCCLICGVGPSFVAVYSQARGCKGRGESSTNVSEQGAGESVSVRRRRSDHSKEMHGL